MKISNILRDTVTSVQKLIKHDLNIVTTDKFVISIKAGQGGSGLIRYNGVGGNGGNVFFVAKPNIAFTDIRKRLKNKLKIRSEPGTSANKMSLIGKHGSHEYFDVPVGVEIVNREKNILIARCNRPFHKYLIAQGGEGGYAKNGYKGSKGECLEIECHLKLRPNIGLLGFPNAGKSTLLKALVPEKSVKIADYPFTTINPQIAFWDASSNSENTEFSEKFTLSIADLPGIIEGASKNRGKGHQFLKHLEYADVIVMVVDVNGFQLKNELNCPFRSPLESIALLNKEVELYDKKLVKKPVICILNKIDTLNENQKMEINKLKSKLLLKDWSKSLPDNIQPTIPMRFEYVLELSAKSGKIEQFQEALNNLRHYLHKLKDVEDDEGDLNRKSRKFI